MTQTAAAPLSVASAALSISAASLAAASGARGTPSRASYPGRKTETDEAALVGDRNSRCRKQPISLVIVGLCIGGVGRLIVPGRNPIGFWGTLGVGLAGSIVGAIVGSLLGLGVLSIVPELAVAAGLVYASGRSGRRGQLMP